MQTQVEELADNRVRLTVDVPRHDIEHAVEHAASDLAGTVKIPGFRKGKVPMPVLISRIGKERLFTEAIESHISGWFWTAAAREGVRPVDQPEFDFALPDSDKEDWRFTATVGVQPTPELPDWKTLEVPRAETEVPEELVAQELEALQTSVAELVPVDDRPAAEGDTVVVDLVGEDGAGQRDYVVQLGSRRLVDEIEGGIVGLRAGDSRTIEFELADDARERVEVVVKEVLQPVLPPLDDELARAASEFGSLAELRADVEASIREQLEAEAEGAFRAAVLDTLVAASGVDARGPIVEARTRELINGLVRSVERRGVPFDTYLTLTNTRPEDLVDRMRAEAKQSVAREIVLEAAADELGIEVADDEIRDLVTEQAEAAGEDPGPVIEDLFRSGADRRLREDLRLKKALDRIAAEVTPISADLAAARDAIWTPQQEKPETAAKLWTPGSKES